MSDDELLDIRQAAAFLNVSEASLRRWTNAGSLACLRVGRRRERRFRRTDLLAFAEHEPGGSGRVPSAQHDHLLGVYGSDGGRTDLVSAMLGHAFRDGRATFFVAGRRSRDAVVSRLHERNPIARSRMEAGALDGFDFGGSVEGHLDELERRFEAALARGATSLCLVSDASAAKGAVGIDGVVDYEARFGDRIARKYAVLTLCLFDVRVFSAGDLMSALKLHPDTFRHPADRLFA